MPRVEPDHPHGSVGAVPSPGVLRPALDLPARPRSREREGAGGDEQAPPPWAGRTPRRLWGPAVAVLASAEAALRSLEGPALVEQRLAVLLALLLVLGLLVRSGTAVPAALLLAAVVGVGAVASQWAPLLAGAAVGTGVSGACLAVLATRPATTPLRVVREVLVAVLLATATGLASAGLAAGVDRERFCWTVLVLAVPACVALVYRLGGGLHGLGRRGLLLAAGALVLLLVVLVYTAALTHYGSPELVEQVGSAQDWTRDHLGGVPHPVEVLVGLPALTWGVSLRARRRQGWWACAFGAAATAAWAGRLVDLHTLTAPVALAAGYSVALGLLLGGGLIRLERLLTGRGGRHSRTHVPLRLEPSRLQALH